MEGSVLSFLKAEWKVSDTGSAHWASSSFYYYFILNISRTNLKRNCISLNYIMFKPYVEGINNLIFLFKLSEVYNKFITSSYLR